jgi:exodeoxyribonuclease V gamma subunit
MPSQLDIALFINQLLTPQQSFYRHTIGARIGHSDEMNCNDEVFALDGLANYIYMREFIEQDYIANPPNLDALIARGDLPHGAGAELALDSFTQTITPLINELKRYQVDPNTAANQERQRVEINTQQLTLTGPLQSIALGKQFLFRPTKKLKPKDKIKGYLYHLVGSASGDVTNTVFLSLNSYIEYEQLTQAEAQAQLQSWVDLYFNMFKRPLPLFAGSGFAYLAKGDLDAAEKCFSGDIFNGSNEVSDPYIALDFITIDAVSDEFIALTEKYLAPIEALITEYKYAKS